MTAPADHAHPQEPGILQRAENWLHREAPEIKTAATDAAALLQPYATHVSALNLTSKILMAVAGGGPFAVLLPEAVILAEQAIADIKAALAAPKSG